MSTGAIEANEAPERNGSPVGIGTVAIDAARVAWERTDQFPTQRREVSSFRMAFRHYLEFLGELGDFWYHTVFYLSSVGEITNNIMDKVQNQVMVAAFRQFGPFPRRRSWNATYCQQSLKPFSFILFRARFLVQNDLSTIALGLIKTTVYSREVSLTSRNQERRTW